MKFQRLSIERVLEEPVSSRMRLSNRSYFGPITTNLNRRSHYTKAYFDFCRRVLSGKAVGIFVFEGAAVSNEEYSYEYQPLASAALPTIRAELLKVKNEFPRTRFLISLVHRGPQGSSALSQKALLGPTSYLDVTSGEVCAEASQEEIDRIIEDYAHAARVAFDVGFDGVEVAAGQFSLIRSFLSPLTNQRDDHFGGDRGLLLRSIMKKIAAELPEGIIGIRQSIDELAPWGGFGPNEAAESLIEIEGDLPGRIGYVLCERGSIYSTAETEADYSAGPLFNVEGTDIFYHRANERLKNERPLIIDSGGIYNDDDVDALFSRERQVELIDLTRPIIADPLFLETSRRPRSCLACNHGCMVGDSRNFPISCAVNAEVSHEVEAPKRLIGLKSTTRLVAPSARRKIAVIGGGVAGMTAALKLSRAKHEVTLFDERPKLGGQLAKYANAHPNKAMARLVEELVSESLQSDINVELSKSVSGYAELEDYDEIVVSTGSKFHPRKSLASSSADITPVETMTENQRHLDPISLFDESTRELLDRESKMVFYDVVGDETSRAIVKRLIALNATFTYICPDPVAFSQLALSNGLVEGNATLIRSGAELIFEAKLVAVEESTCVVEEIYGQSQRVMNFDYLIETNRYFANDRPFRDGRGVIIGDALAPRSIRSAIAEGSRLIGDIEHVDTHIEVGAQR
ncbi:MAG: FAD-dependent oxidoreductase [Actinomycetota bacterium]|nr:FAD-dependent oxidoreductase [Actinomycetota bacterium]